MKIGKLEKIKLRELWEREDKDFSFWPSKNLEHLNESINQNLALVDKKARVTKSRFEIDIVAKNEDVNGVTIENQREPTEHEQLGQLIEKIKELESTLKSHEDEIIAQEKRIDTKEKFINNMKGIITMWAGQENQIPEGWVLCDGQKDTPDLRDKFVVGAGIKYSVGNTGGKEKVKLIINEMPNHNHGVNDPGHNWHREIVKQKFINSGGHGDTDDTHPIIEKTGITIQNSGGGQAHENRPPYYALCFIMKE